MLVTIPDVVAGDALVRLRGLVEAGEWIDGNATSGAQSALAKRNRQLREGSEAAQAAGALVLDALAANARFVAAALPLKVFPPLFSRYEGGEAFAAHVDTAIRILRGSDFRIRSDLSATLFLSDAESYDGGALVIAGSFGEQRVKLPAGHLVLYPASSLHRVEPVTRGARLAGVFWLQSMVRDEAARRVLLDLDESVQMLAGECGQGDAVVVKLTGVYHNLLRMWAEA